MTKEIRRLGIVLMALFLALLLNVTWLQVVRGEELANHPGNTRKAVRDFSRARGAITTADGTVIAESVPSDDSFKRLRRYPQGELFGHITGYLSFKYGTDGLERTYNDELTGRDIRVRLNGIGDAFTERSQTADVILTLRKDVQEVARNALGNRRGAVVALDPRTGAVIALWSFPSYDPNPLAGHDMKAVTQSWDLLQLAANNPMLPRAYRQRYAPGSTFKVVTAAAAVERKPELVGKPYPSEKTLDLPQTDRDLPNFGGGTCGGPLPDLLRVSCNTGFARLGIDLGAEALSGEAQDFGFNDRPPLDLPVTARSAFPEASAFDRNIPALAYSSIGQQDVAASPLQMALVAGAIGNGGVVMKPHVMAEIRDEDAKVLKRYSPEPWKQAVSPQAAAAVRDMMVNVVARGTGTRAQIPGVTVGGKTGTAQTVGPNAHAWFIGFAPAEAPEVAVAVIIESQDGVSEATGGRLAAPIAQAVMRAVLGR